MKIFEKHVHDRNILWLLGEVLGSFSAGEKRGVGLPLGNLTSQLFVNVYMNEFDQFVKHALRIPYYIRYADDFVILSEDRRWLEKQLSIIKLFLSEKLRLTLHPKKISIKTLTSGIDFLGWVHFPNHRVLRTTTKRRMFKRIEESQKPETINSYMGLLKHGNTHTIRKRVVVPPKL